MEELDEVQARLREYRLHLREQQWREWKRSLPMEEEAFDRWERARFLGFGPDSSIYQSALVFGDVRVGRNTWIGPFCVLDGSGGLEIGDNCSISSGAQIYTHDTVKKRLAEGETKASRQATRIGDSCYLGPLSVIGKGVEIGDHSAVGALSYVKRSVDARSFVAGVPAKLLGKVDPSSGEIDRLRPSNEEESKRELLAEIEELRSRIDRLENLLEQ